MSEIATNGPYTFSVPVGTAVSKYRLVKIDANGDLAHASGTDDVLGVCCNDVPSAEADRIRGNTASVVGLNHSGVLRFVAASAVSVADPLYKAAAGKVDNTGTELLGYVAISAATADGDVIDAVPIR